jgi:hypothetical protein
MSKKTTDAQINWITSVNLAKPYGKRQLKSSIFKKEEL